MLWNAQAHLCKYAKDLRGEHLKKKKTIADVIIDCAKKVRGNIVIAVGNDRCRMSPLASTSKVFWAQEILRICWVVGMENKVVEGILHTINFFA